MIKEINYSYNDLICRYLNNFGNINPSYESYDKYFIYEEESVKGFSYFQIFYERAELLYLFVDEKFRGCGIAFKLLSDNLDKLNKLGVNEVSLEVNVNNKEAINLYKKCGFSIVKTIENYYHNENAYLMFKRL